jgi:hypothetical protein
MVRLKEVVVVWEILLTLKKEAEVIGLFVLVSDEVVRRVVRRRLILFGGMSSLFLRRFAMLVRKSDECVQVVPVKVK